MRHVLVACFVVAVAVLGTGCSSSKLSRSASSPRVTSLLDEAESHIGTAYCSGGTTRDCFDCSGFVTTCFLSIGIPLPRTSRDIAAFGVEIRRDELQPGDVVAFRTSGREVNHVGIMVDAERFIHASTSKGVIVSALSESYWKRSYVGARRVLQR